MNRLELGQVHNRNGVYERRFSACYGQQVYLPTILTD